MTPEDSKKVGGSDVASVMGLSRYGSAYAVYQRIVYGVEKDDTAPMRRGRRMEAHVLDEYAETNKLLFRSVRLAGLLEHERASLDAIGATEGLYIPVEGKSVSWRSMGDWGEKGTDAIPQEYLLQCQWYAGSLHQDPTFRGEVGDIIHVPADVGGEYGLWVVQYDEELYGLLREGVAKFWRDYVVPQRPPEPTSLSNDAESIRKRFPRNMGKHLEWDSLYPEAHWLLVHHRQAVREVSEAEKERDAASVLVKALIGEASGIHRLPDGSRLDWKTDKDSRVTDWEAVARAMAASQHWMRDAEHREFDELVKAHTTTVTGKRPLVWREKKGK